MRMPSAMGVSLGNPRQIQVGVCVGLVVAEVLMGLVLLLLLLEEYDKTGADNDDFTFNVAT